MLRDFEARFLIGTQADDPGGGIVSAVLDERTGEISVEGVVAEVARPTWLLKDRQRPLVYAVSEVGNKGDRDGEVLSFKLTENGQLEPVGRCSSLGGGPTHLAIEPDGSALFVANFGGGQAACIPIGPDGALADARAVPRYEGSGPHRRQQRPHPHGVTLDPSQRFLLVPDMGADRVFVHRYVRRAKSLAEAPHGDCELPAGSGPRLLLFGPGGKRAYLLSELSAELFVFDWNEAIGTLTEVQVLPLDGPGVECERSAAALVMSSDGRHLYASNRRTNAIHTYWIGADDGRLTSLQVVECGGVRPWGAAISPVGSWFIVANQESGEVVSLPRDRNLGTLGSSVQGRAGVETPTSIEFV